MRIQKLSRTQKLLAAAAMAFLASAGTASANITFDFTYSIMYSPNTGGGNPGDVTFTDDGATDVHGNVTLASPYSTTVGTTQTTPRTFFTANPQGSYCGGTCTNNTASGTISVTFTFTQPTGISQFTETAAYIAQYSGTTTLSCSGKSGQTDCIDWKGASNGTSSGVLDVTLTTALGNIDIYLQNASDWSISPHISFQDIPVPTPGPVAGTGLPGMALAIGMIGLVGWCRRRKAQVA